RDAEPAAPDLAVHVEQRSGGVPELPVVLHCARGRAPVVGPGGWLEELPRAVDQRRVLAVLRGPLRGARTRRRAVHVGTAPDEEMGGGSLPAGAGVSRVPPRA